MVIPTCFLDSFWYRKQFRAGFLVLVRLPYWTPPVMSYFSSYFFPHLVCFSGLKVILPGVTVTSPLSEHADEHLSMTLASTKRSPMQSRHKFRQWISLPPIVPWLCLLQRAHRVPGPVFSSLHFCQQLVFSVGQIQAVKCSSRQVQPVGLAQHIQLHHLAKADLLSVEYKRKVLSSDSCSIARRNELIGVDSGCGRPVATL